MLRIVLALLIIYCFTFPAGAQSPTSRFFYSGDGKIHLVSKKSKAAFSGSYRKVNGSYDEVAMRKINTVFGARYGTTAGTVEPRFIEFLDFLEDKLAPGATITIVSGYRSPSYNTRLRENGKLAAKASLHQYAMAADLKLGNTSSETVWNFIKELGYGGAGYYHGGLVHIDVGPARSWDETTSGVGTNISEENKLIAAVVDRDIYLPGEDATIDFIRMTAYPIGFTPELILEKINEEGKTKAATKIQTSISRSGLSCPQFTDMASLADIQWQVPLNQGPGRYRLRALFCDKQWEAMPADIVTSEFEIRAPLKILDNQSDQ